MSLASPLYIAGTVLSVLAWLREKRKSKRLDREITQLQDSLAGQVKERSAERTGRVKAEKRLRQHLAEASTGRGPEEAYPLRPIGHLQSCFSQRNGTPRQPLLVPAARAQLILRPDIPAGCLDGLERFSHVWLLFVFHANTDLHRLWSASHAADGLKAKVGVPRLNGGRLGVLATRSPHRPSPIGLSVAKVISVEGRRLVVGGADIVDGSPILDVKPYVPFCDSLHDATAPEWVSDACEEDPLAIAEVVIPPDVRLQLEQCWAGQGAGAALRRQLFSDLEAWLALVQQALGRDIRSVHQRLRDGGAAEGGGSVELQKDGAQAVQGRTHNDGRAGAAPGQYQVVLQGIKILYDVSGCGAVHLQGAHAA